MGQKQGKVGSLGKSCLETSCRLVASNLMADSGPTVDSDNFGEY